MTKKLSGGNLLVRRIGFRLTEKDYLYYKSLLNETKTQKGVSYTQSDFIRDSIFSRPLESLVTFNKKVTIPKPSKCDKTRIRMLVNTTNNINQIAKSLNILLNGGNEDLFESLVQINDIHKHIKSELL